MPLAPFESSIAERYHEETRYSAEALRREAQHGPPLDWALQPAPFRAVEGTRTVLPVDGLPLVRRNPCPPSPDGGGPGRADARRLARILWHTNGCTRIVPMGAGVHHFRAAPSAGAMYPTEVYVATRGVPGVPDGIHDYQILDHSLASVRSTDVWDALVAACFGHPAVAAAQAVVILTGAWQRSAWRYRERGYRRALLDTGHVLGNLVECAPEEEFRAVPLACFRDDLLERMLATDPIDEGPLVVVPLVPSEVAAGLPDMPLRASPATEWKAAVAAVGTRLPPESPRRLSAALHLAGRLDADAPSAMPPAPAPLVPAAGALSVDASAQPTTWDADEPVTATIAVRRSTRAFLPAEMPRDALFRALAHAYPDGPSPFFAAGLIRTYLVAINVTGLPPGTYACDPVAHRVIELSRGQHARSMHHLALGQDIFVNAGAAVIHTADLTRAVERFGDRVYRLLGLDAGHVGERLGLALLHEGLGVSGCGGYYDDEMNRVLGIPESQAVVYITAAGVPAA